MHLPQIADLVGELVSVGLLAAIGAAIALRLTRDVVPAPATATPAPGEPNPR